MTGLALTLPEEVMEEIVERVAEVVLTRLADDGAPPPSPYLTVTEAGGYLRCKPQRIRDLLSARRLTTHKDGSRTLVSRAELAAYVQTSGHSRKHDS